MSTYEFKTTQTTEQALREIDREIRNYFLNRDKPVEGTATHTWIFRDVQYESLDNEQRIVHLLGRLWTHRGETLPVSLRVQLDVYMVTYIARTIVGIIGTVDGKNLREAPVAHIEFHRNW